MKEEGMMMRKFLLICLILLNGMMDSSVGLTQSLQPEECFETTDELASSILWSPDGEWIVVGGRHVHLYQSPFEYIRTFNLPENSFVYGMDWKSDSSQLAILLTNNHVIVWDVITDEIVLDWDVGIRHVRHLDWSPDDSKIGVSGAEQYLAIYYFIDNTTEILEFDIENAFFGDFEWAWDSRLFAWDRGSDTVIYDLQMRERVSWLLGARSYNLAWRPQPRDYTLLMGTAMLEGAFTQPQRQMIIYSWNFVTQHIDIVGVFIRPHGAWHVSYFYALQWRPDGEYFASLSSDEKIRIWKFGDLNIRLEFDAYPTQNYTISDAETDDRIAWRPDGQQLAQASDLGICFWDMSMLD